MISVRVNEIFNYLSTDRKKVLEQCRQRSRPAAAAERSVNSQLRVTPAVNAVGDTAEGGCRNSQSVGEEDSDAMSSSSLPSLENECDTPPSCDHSADEKTDVLVSTQGSIVDLDNDFNTSSISHSGSISSTSKVKTKVSGDKSKHLKSDAKNIVERLSPHIPVSEPPVVANKKNSSAANVSTNSISRQPRQYSTVSENVCSSIPASAKNRKKRSRRNQVRCPTSTTALDSPSDCTSASATDIAEKSMNCEIKKTGKVVEDIVTKDECRKSVLDKPRRTAVAEKTVVANCSSPAFIETPIRTTSGIAELDLFDTLRFTPSPLNISVLDSNKIDSLDSFDDFLLPYCPTTFHSCSLTDSDDQWTEVNRRCKKFVVELETFNYIVGLKGNKLEEVSRTSGAHIDTELNGDKAIIIIKGNSDQIQSAYSIVSAMASNPTNGERHRTKQRHRGGVASKTNLPSRAQLDNYCQVRSADTSKTASNSVVTAVASSTNVASSRSAENIASKTNLSSAGSSPRELNDSSRGQFPEQRGHTQGPNSLKEYSLFDNVFSRTVEQAMGRRDTPPPPQQALPSRTAVYITSMPSGRPMQPNVVVDHALLAKAPGYRIGAGSQFSALVENYSPPLNVIQWEPRTRKYSDSSSSGRSSEDSGVGSIVSGFAVQPPLPGHHIRVDPQFEVAERSSPVGHSWSPNGIRLPEQQCEDVPKFVDNSPVCRPPKSVAPVMIGASRGDQYCSPDEPMTLPRIASDLNPNAPDFVYEPVHRIPPGPVAPTTVYTAERSSFIPQSSLVSSFSELAAGNPPISESCKAIGSERKHLNGKIMMKHFNIDEFMRLAATTDCRRNPSQFDVCHPELSAFGGSTLRH